MARNAGSLGAVTALLSVVGDDDAGRTLGRLLEEGQIDAGLHVDADIDTIVKLRVIGRQQQLLRIDFETPPSHEILQAKLADFESRVNQCDVVILSDYGKGGLTHIAEMIRIARAADKPVLVDPKGDDWAKYAGATVITPNRGELKQVVGSWKDEAELAAKAPKLRLPFAAVLDGRPTLVAAEFLRPSPLGIAIAIRVFWWAHRFIGAGATAFSRTALAHWLG